MSDAAVSAGEHDPATRTFWKRNKLAIAPWLFLAPGLFMKSLIQGSRLFVMPNTGHVLNLEEPELFNTVLEEFLADVEAGKGLGRD